MKTTLTTDRTIDPDTLPITQAKKINSTVADADKSWLEKEFEEAYAKTDSQSALATPCEHPFTLLARIAWPGTVSDGNNERTPIAANGVGTLSDDTTTTTQNGAPRATAKQEAPSAVLPNTVGNFADDTATADQNGASSASAKQEAQSAAMPNTVGNFADDTATADQNGASSASARQEAQPAVMPNTVGNFADDTATADQNGASSASTRQEAQPAVMPNAIRNFTDDTAAVATLDDTVSSVFNPAHLQQNDSDQSTDQDVVATASLPPLPSLMIDKGSEVQAFSPSTGSTEARLEELRQLIQQTTASMDISGNRAEVTIALNHTLFASTRLKIRTVGQDIELSYSSDNAAESDWFASNAGEITQRLSMALKRQVRLGASV